MRNTFDHHTLGSRDHKPLGRRIGGRSNRYRIFKCLLHVYRRSLVYRVSSANVCQMQSEDCFNMGIMSASPMRYLFQKIFCTTPYHVSRYVCIQLRSGLQHFPGQLHGPSHSERARLVVWQDEDRFVLR